MTFCVFFLLKPRESWKFQYLRRFLSRRMFFLSLYKSFGQKSRLHLCYVHPTIERTDRWAFTLQKHTIGWIGDWRSSSGRSIVVVGLLCMRTCKNLSSDMSHRVWGNHHSTGIENTRYFSNVFWYPILYTHAHLKFVRWLIIDCHASSNHLFCLFFLRWLTF